ncbi:TetR/AcrR family transcriptional regulator [Skermania piniformis]|uniref:TetR/AcrR family transcriptional regulator n=1 Tax=Skermania pinensis TaxID=39122 RepID=A0ABX8S6Q7_9ACTN|nr:TetR/AcrR family transcriptional regulator [Skermania piniformis]QXQ12936.1 TetR/AcrR family transcriptional regulator [Skermania piniformis]
MSDLGAAPKGREARRRETHRRVLDAATEEYRARGMADADLGAIIAAAGVARGTFYFHFPTKEHVLLEIEAREEKLIAEELTRFLAEPHDLRDSLAETIRSIAAMETRLGRHLFKDLLSVHFSPTRPLTDEWRAHPVIGLVAGMIRDANRSGEAETMIDPYHSAVFFLFGLYGLLAITTGAAVLRDTVIRDYLDSTLRSLQPR